MKTILVAVTSAGLLMVACSSGPAPAPVSPATEATATPSSGTARVRVTIGERFTPLLDTASLRAFVPEIAATDSGGECSVIRTGGSGATVVTASFPSRTMSRNSVSLTFDSLGHLVRYSERRGDPSRITGMQGKSDAARDSAMAAQVKAHRSTSINMDFAIDQAVVMNSGGGQPTHAVLGTVRMVEGLESLGPPSARLTRVRKLCGV